MRVRIFKCDWVPLAVGLKGEVVNYDYVPWCQASIDNPLIDVNLDSGFQLALSLSEVRLCPGE